ncbi:MAG: hypothetical protein WBF87_07180 [Mesorhizobium sp.]
MPFQNRVDPFGDIHAVAARGMFTGNRGTIHDADTQTLLKKRWATKMWIICDCGYKGRKRVVMGRNRSTGGPGWTNLFFLDEVTALSAGHRPCFECRRADAKEFARCFAAGQAQAHMSAPQIDAVLHPQRRATGAATIALSKAEIEALPDGAMIAVGNAAYAIRGGEALAWSFDGYGPAQGLPDRADLLTPAATVGALKAGFKPVWHGEAG